MKDKLALQMFDQMSLLKGSWVTLHVLDLTWAIARNEFPSSVKLSSGVLLVPLTLIHGSRFKGSGVQALVTIPSGSIKSIVDQVSHLNPSYLALSEQSKGLRIIIVRARMESLITDPGHWGRVRHSFFPVKDIMLYQQFRMKPNATRVTIQCIIWFKI